MPLKWFPASSFSSPDSELGSGEGLSAALQLTAGLCSHSHEGAGGANLLSESLWGKAAKGPAVPILGWTEPWVSRSQAGERALLSQEVRVVLYLQCSWDSVGSAPALSTATESEKHQDPDVVTDPEPVKRSMWPPQPGRAAPALTIHRTQAVSTSSPTDSPFPISLRKCSVPQHLSDALLLSCSHTHPS